MGSKSNQVSTNTSQQYTPNAPVGAAGTQAITAAQGLAQSPFAMPTAPVAGFNPFQQQAFGQTQGLQGFSQPYFNQGQQYLQQSAAPISGQDVANYYNPMAQSVTNQMQNIFGQQQQATTGQLTQAAGGVGADRIAVGQSELANQQGLAAGQTYAGLYQQALQAAQQQKQMQAGAGYGISQMGPAALNSALTETGALGAAGGQQQQLSQAQMNAGYQNQLAQIAWPYQNNQYLASITGGLAPALGGSTQGQSTTTYPSPSPLSQVLGLGTSALGLFGGLGGFGGGFGKGASASSPQLIGGQFERGGAAMADGGSTYGKLADQAYRHDVSAMLPQAQAGNPYDAEALQAIGGSLPTFADGGDIQNAPPPVPGLAVPRIGGGAPIPYLPLGMGAGHSGLLTGGLNMQTPMMRPQTDTLGNQASQALKMASSLPNLFGSNSSGYGDMAEGGAVNPYDFGQHFADGGSDDSPASFDDRFFAAGDAPPVEAMGADPSAVLGNAMQGAIPAPQARPNVGGFTNPEQGTVQSAFSTPIKEAGGSPNLLGGIFMNVPDESGWNSSLRHPDQPKFGGEAHYAHGLLQEGGDEWNNYQSWMKQNAPNGNWRDPALQGQFTAWNLKNNYPDLWDKMNNAKTPGEAAAQFVKGYLKPAQQFQVARANKYLGSDGDETLPSGATPVSYSGNTRYAQNDTGTMSDANPYQMPQGQQPYPDALKRDWGQNLARSPWMSLVRAGAAMASTTGPVGTAIAHGMAAGAGELDTQRKSLQTEEGVNLKAQQLYQQAKQHLDQYTRMTPYQAQEAAKPVIVAQTVDAYGRTHATYGQRQPDGTFVDPITQKPIDQKTISGQTSGPDPTTLSGDEYLKTLPPGLANTVKQIANGDVGINNVGYRDRTAVLGAVSQYDPSFNTYTAPMRAQAAKNYTGSGVEARNFTSNDMAIKHIGTGLSNIEALHNSTYPMYNAIANPLARNVGNTQVQSALTGLKTDIDAVGSELMRSFRGSGSASEREATEWRSNFPINGSPVEQRRAFQEAANLLAGRITAAGHRYNDAMGPMHSRDPLSWLSPEGRAIINYTTNQLDPQKPIPPNFKQLGSQSQGNAPSQAQPSQSDIDYVRAHPEVKDKFIQRFGREP